MDGLALGRGCAALRPADRVEGHRGGGWNAQQGSDAAGPAAVGAWFGRNGSGRDVVRPLARPGRRGTLTTDVRTRAWFVAGIMQATLEVAVGRASDGALWIAESTLVR